MPCVRFRERNRLGVRPPSWEEGQATTWRAHAVHPVTVLQSDYSLWARDGDV